jgi:hypothetical protein
MENGGYFEDGTVIDELERVGHIKSKVEGMEEHRYDTSDTVRADMNKIDSEYNKYIDETNTTEE